MRFFSKRLALVLSYVSWVFSIGISISKSWHVWEFDSDVITMMYIGLWETSYVQRVNTSGNILKLPMRAELNESWDVPQEIYYGQELMLLANFMTPVTLYFGSLAVWVSWTDALYPDFLQACYISALFLIVSGFCITVTVSWNFIADIYGKTTLDFPPDFPVGREMVKVKYISYVLPLGIVSVILALVSALIFSYEWYSNIQWCQKKPTPVLTDSGKES
ncbi:uncharacterized protein LOC128627871 [Artibeus jamaicensis]|uniref:uncharacterized protein LOC128627871 n=1 Tax=Artibeus jamaicensis TaxID=9417 RepID=UPI00235B2EBD|nr:uncharacterized protein LOC128627871 [Artibeus jamaicensis]